jgi:hypothetical protein
MPSPKAAPASTTIHLDLLKNISIASPCEARWEDMLGDDKVRHCTLCALNVHNLSAMTREEAESLVHSKQQEPSRRLCVRFYQRTDGTILTQDCPRGLAALRVRARHATARTALRVAALFGLTGVIAAASNAGGPGNAGRGQWAARSTTAVRWLTSRLNPPPPVIMGKMRMGDFAPPRTPQPPPTAAGTSTPPACPSP